MIKKKSIILFFIFMALLILFYFLIFNKQVFAPQTISVKNTGEVVNSEPENNNPPEENLPVKVEEEKPVNPIMQTEIKKETANDKITIIDKFVSWGFSSASNRKIDTIIIHSSYNALGGDEYSVEKLIAEYKEYGVAPHYLIDRQGKIYQLVADKNIAYHAGESKTPDGRTSVNNFSIGIEMISTKEDKYASEQYISLNSLLSILKSRYSIKYILGHKDISPNRKTDPWNFDWGKIN